MTTSTARQSVELTAELTGLSHKGRQLVLRLQKVISQMEGIGTALERVRIYEKHRQVIHEALDDLWTRKKLPKPEDWQLSIDGVELFITGE